MFYLNMQHLNKINNDKFLTSKQKYYLSNIYDIQWRRNEYIKIAHQNFRIYQDWIKNLRNNPDAKRRIEFPNRKTFIIENRDSKQILSVKETVRDYIDNSNFEDLIKAKRYCFVPIGSEIMEIPYNNSQRNKKIVEELQAKLKEHNSNMNIDILNQIVTEYICKFLLIDIMEISEDHRIQDKNQILDTVQPTTLFNNEDGEGAIEAGRVNLVYSARGVGKSYFAIEVAKSPLVTNPLYIMLDDISDEQKPRIKHPRLQDKITLIDYQEWEKRYSEIKEKAVNKAHNQAREEVWNQVIIEKSQELKLLSICLNKNRQVTKRQEEIMKSLGFEEKKVVSNIIVLESVLKKAVEDKRDLIIIDSLQGLLPGYINHLTYDDIKEITKELIKNKITLILLHHENEQGQSKGSKAILDMFPYVYRLRADDKDDNKLYLDTEKARSSGKQTFILKRTFEEKYFATHTIISNNSENKESKTNMKSMIKEIIEKYDGEILLYQELVDALEERTGKEKDEANIKKHLKSLKEKDNLIDMADGNTWKGGIKILSPESIDD